MTLPIESARQIVESVRADRIQNLIAQAKAKQVLKEVHETPENFPKFEPDLDDRVTFVAYGLLAAGCSLVERGKLKEGYEELHTAADILASTHQTEIEAKQASALHCLIGAMAFYSCGQYSRAFVLIKNVEGITKSAGIVASFLRKDYSSLISQLNATLLPAQPELDDSNQFDDWALTVCIARAVALTAEHSFSGQSALLTNADAVLHDAMLISEADSDPNFWWIARLLRLMLKDYGSGSLWSVLPSYFGPNGSEQVASYVKLLAFLNPPVTELWQSQTAALHLALNPQNRGGVINLRTSAGKTRVAELSILHTLKTDPTAKILYLAPFRSLAFELERTFSKTLSPLGYHVSHLYGGARFSGIDRELVNEGHITIATPEKAKAMLRAAPELFNSVKLVVIDEGHLLGHNERNVRNELFLEHVRLLARQGGARILLLSAVLPNAEDLADWVGGDVKAMVKSNWKPSGERFGVLRWRKAGVSIEWLGGERCFNPHFIDFKQVPSGNDSARQFPRTKTEAVAATAARLAELGPVLIFAGQAQWVPSMARNVLLAFGSDAPAHPWPDTEWRVLEAVCKEELGDDSLELTAARLGVICHSNKLPPQVRMSLEKLMAKHPPRVIVATTTLGQGVNIGISSVIVATTFIGAQLQISKRDFWNICGRAGRAFVDGEGKILFAVDCTRSDWQVNHDEQTAREYFDVVHLDRVESGLLQVIQTLQQVAAIAGISFETILELAAHDKFDRYGENQATVEHLFDWIDDQLLALHVAYKGDDLAPNVDWVDDAFRNSLASIQERNWAEFGGNDHVLSFLKARAVGVINKVPSLAARHAITASGLPLSVGIAAFNQLDVLREIVDRYLIGGGNSDALVGLVLEVETWCRENAKSIFEGMPDQALLDVIRPRWLSGVPLQNIVETCGGEVNGICTELYGYKLPWILHSIAQKLNKLAEEIRIEALSKVALLVELGLPTEAAAKVFLAGVRSRTAAVELSSFVTNATSSITSIRNALLEPATVEMLTFVVTAPTLEWLALLSEEHRTPGIPHAQSIRFSLDVPDDDVNTLHVRQLTPQGPIFLCSTDGRFKVSVKVTEELPFDRFADNPRYVFLRDGDAWVQECRDPRIPST